MTLRGHEAPKLIIIITSKKSDIKISFRDGCKYQRESKPIKIFTFGHTHGQVELYHKTNKKQLDFYIIDSSLLAYQNTFQNVQVRQKRLL